MSYGCIKCSNLNIGGGSMESWERRGIITDLKLLHKIERFSIYKCNRCNSHFIYNDKVFDDCLESHIPALLHWPNSLEFFEKNKEEIRPVFQNKIFDTLYGGAFEITYEQKTENAIILLFDEIISNEHYDPLKPLPNGSTIKFLRHVSPEEIANKNTTKYLVKYDEPF